MEKRTSITARILAPLALIAAVLLIVFVVSSSTGNDDGSATSPKGNGNPGKQQGSNSKPKKKVKVYVVQPNDTLTGIAAANGVTVDQIERLNPDIDPQALQADAKLKLR